VRPAVRALDPHGDPPNFEALVTATHAAGGAALVVAEPAEVLVELDGDSGTWEAIEEALGGDPLLHEFAQDEDQVDEPVRSGSGPGRSGAGGATSAQPEG
jgi:hypothetical protein